MEDSDFQWIDIALVLAVSSPLVLFLLRNEIKTLWQILAASPKPKNGNTDTRVVNHPMALTGFILGLISVVLYQISILPVLAIVFSAIGLGGFDQTKHKNRWLAVLGLILGCIYTFMCLYKVGYLD